MGRAIFKVGVWTPGLHALPLKRARAKAFPFQLRLALGRVEIHFPDYSSQRRTPEEGHQKKRRCRSNVFSTVFLEWPWGRVPTRGSLKTDFFTRHVGKCLTIKSRMLSFRPQAEEKLLRKTLPRSTYICVSQGACAVLTQ